MTKILYVNNDIRRDEQLTAALASFHIKPYRVNTMQDTIPILSQDKEILCVVIDEYATSHALHYLAIMREITDSPIFILTDSYVSKKHADALRAGAHYYGAYGDTIKDEIDVIFEIVKQYNSYATRKTADVLICDDVMLSLSGHYVVVQGVSLSLSKIEFDLLRALMKNPGTVLTFEQLFSRIWGSEYVKTSHEVLWTTIRRLRNKLKISPDSPERIENVRGVGYRFAPDIQKSESHIE